LLFVLQAASLRVHEVAQHGMAREGAADDCSALIAAAAHG
jgi:hypothetical protein